MASKLNPMNNSIHCQWRHLGSMLIGSLTHKHDAHVHTMFPMKRLSTHFSTQFHTQLLSHSTRHFTKIFTKLLCFVYILSQIATFLAINQQYGTPGFLFNSQICMVCTEATAISSFIEVVYRPCCINGRFACVLVPTECEQTFSCTDNLNIFSSGQVPRILYVYAIFH